MWTHEGELDSAAEACRCGLLVIRVAVFGDTGQSKVAFDAIELARHGGGRSVGGSQKRKKGQ